MPIFWLMRLTSGGGRSRRSSPRQSLSMEMAASWPCATAQMIFLGPKAESPPKNTRGTVDCMVSGSTVGMPARSNSRPISRSIQGKAFSCPIATSTSSHAMWTSGSAVGTRLRRPSAPTRAAIFSNSRPAGLVGESLGCQEIVDGDAFMRGILLLPGRGFHLGEAAAHDDLNIVAAQAARRAAAVHRRVAAAEHDDALPDLVDMAEGDIRQ